MELRIITDTKKKSVSQGHISCVFECRNSAGGGRTWK